MNLSEYSILRPITVLMAIVSILVLGYLSLQRLPLALLPDFEGSNLRVSVDYPSSSPHEVEWNITRPLEEVLSTLDYLESVQSTSSSNGSSVRLEFEHGTDMDLISLDVRDRIDQVRNRLPTDVERVVIRRWQTTDMPVIRFSVGWQGDREELYRFIEEILRPRMERVDGVANVEIRGVDPKQIIIDLDHNLLQAHGVDVFNLSQAVRNNNVNISGGWIVDGEKKYALRTLGEFQSVEELENLPLADGRLRLSDVASVRHDFPMRDSFSRLNGQEAVSVSLYKVSTANVVRVCEGIRQELQAIEAGPQYADTLLIQVFSDQSEEILKSLNDLKQAGLYGAALAMVVLFLFLMKVWSTLIISLSIPISIVFTCALMYLLRVLFGSDISLNVVSLMGLMVAVGMLVDSSVVVLENIFRYKQEKGLKAQAAAIRGSREVGTAVLASTATTVTVFVSFIFVPNSGMGRFIRDFGLVVSTALIAGLLVSLTLIPMLAARIFTGKERPKHKLVVWLRKSYGWLMTGLLRWRFVSLLLMVAVGYVTFLLFTSIDRELFPRVTERRVGLRVMMERSFSPKDMQEIFERLEGSLLERKEELEIDSVSARYNSRSSSSGQYRGELNVYLKQEGIIKPTRVLQEQIRAALPEIPGVEFIFGRRRHYGGGGEMGVEVQLVGDDPVVLAQFGETVKARLMELSDIKDVQTTLETGDDEIHLVVDRKRAENLGVSTSLVARTVSSALSTRATSHYKSDNGEVDIVFQLEGNNQISIQQLQNIRLENRQGELIPLSSMVNYRFRQGPLAIRRDDRKSVLSVVGNTDRGSSMRVSRMASQVMDELQLPAGYSWSLGRQWSRFRRSEGESYFAIFLALIFMYIIMAALFESFVHPLTILCTVPFSLIGVAVIFYLTDTSLNQMAYLGILVLFGIVVNNGIILVDHINVLRRQGMPREKAILQGGMDRLRPILMTAATSVFGLLPLTLPFLFPEAFSAVEGRARMWAPVSLAVFGGLTTSTFLTLIILPPIYSYVDDASLGCLKLGSRSWAFLVSRLGR